MSDSDSSTTEVNCTQQQQCSPGGFPLSRCKHNNFDNTRVKKGRVSLRCRDCGVKWRAPHPLKNLCSEFYETRGLCSLGSSCPYLHVHRFKCTIRSPQHAEYVGEDRDDLLRECAIAIFTSLRPRRPLPRSVMPQIMELYRLRKASSSRDPLETKPPSESPMSLMLPPAATSSKQSSSADPHESERPLMPPATTQETAAVEPIIASESEQVADAPHGSIETCLPRGTREAPVRPSASVMTRRLLPITARYVPTQRKIFQRAGKADV